MKIIVNGEEKEILAAGTILSLLQELDLNPAMIAVEKNEQIIPSRKYESEKISEGDVFELIRFMGGGSC